MRKKGQHLPQCLAAVPLHNCADIHVTGELWHVLAHRGQYRRPGFGIVDELTDCAVERAWMVGVFDVIRIRPAMRSRANLDWFSIAPRKSYIGLRIRRDHNHNLDLPRFDRPPGLGQTVGGNMPCSRMGETTSWLWPDIEVAIPRTGRREATHGAVQPATVHPATVQPATGAGATLQWAEPQRRVAPGQSVVLYRGDEVLGGGIAA